MQSCEFVMSITALACNIAKNRTSDEISLIGAFFSQLGDTLATIAAQQELCTPDDSSKS